MHWFLSLGPVLQAFLVSLLMYLMTALGAAAVFFTRKEGGRFLVLLTGAAAGIMIAASFFSLLLPAMEYQGSLPSFVTVTLGFLLGGGFLVLSDLALSRSKLRFFGHGDRKCTLLYLAVTLHNIPEGMAVGVAFAQCAGVLAAAGTAGAAGAAEAAGTAGVLSALLLGVGIAVQNFPEGMCVAFPLRARGMSAFKSFLFSQGSGAVEIPACVIGAALAAFITGLMPWALSFSAGAMIAVVCSELIPECFEKNKTLSSLGVVLGFCLMMLLDIALG